MDHKLAPEICSGTYFPRRGKPQRGYYVVLDEIVLSGPFARKREATVSLEELNRKSVERIMAQPAHAKHLPPEYARTIELVLRKQEKVLTAAMGAAS